MKKKAFASVAFLALLISMLAGCGDKTPTEMKVVFRNSSGYVFNELYVTPTADTEWGSDHLGSTSVLKKGGTFELTLPIYDFNTYDIRVVDVDEDVYLFERVPIENGCEVDIVWESDLAASVSYTDKDSTYIVGVFESGNDDYYSDDYDSGWLDMTFMNYTGWDFREVYVYATGSSDMGYNHVADSPLYDESQHAIGVDDYVYFDIVCVDQDYDTWTFTDIYLEDGCSLTFYYSSDDGAFFEIWYTDNSVSSYYGEIT